MSIQVSICKKLNRLFPLPVHPFNLQNEGVKTYAQWQFEKGSDTIKFFLEKYSTESMFKGKTVLDIGCGAAGKTLYYAASGAGFVYGMDIVPEYKEEAWKLAREKGLEEKFEFILGDAAALPFDEDCIDTIIMNDAMEHVANPEKVLEECYRVLKPGGRIFINFPPYHHPFGAHLSDTIGIPWVHLFFSEKTLIQVYKDLVSNLPDGQKRINFRISKDQQEKEFFSYINKMTIKRFERILKQSPFKVEYRRNVPLRSFLKPISALPAFKEAFTKMVVAVLVKA